MDRLKYLAYILFTCTLLFSCSSNKYNKTVPKIDLERFMGDWYVLAGRLTFLEEGAHNALEQYELTESGEIDIKFTMNVDSFEGEQKKVPQSGKVLNKTTNAHWEVSPFWPLSFDYLVIHIADDYSWTAIGVPSGKYLWIMARDWKTSRENIDKMISEVAKTGYPINDIKYVPQKW